jgi:hypothetical protein
MMQTLFHALPRTAQSDFRSRYLAFLKERDGAPIQTRYSFLGREKFFQQLEASPLRWAGAPLVDAEVFARNLNRRVPEEGLDQATLWALAVAKVNRSERFGVERALARRGFSKDSAEDPYTYTEIEEFYHTRILRDVVESLGLHMEMQPPPPLTKLTIQGMVYLPKPIANVFVLAGEIGGVFSFARLMEMGRALLAPQPAVQKRVIELFEQILTDEIGHVLFLRSTLGPLRLKLVQRVLPLVMHQFLEDLPEMAQLFGKSALLAEATSENFHSIAKRYAPVLAS